MQQKKGLWSQIMADISNNDLIEEVGKTEEESWSEASM